MGSTLTRMVSWRHRQTPVKIVMLGLDAAGKTTMLYKLKLGEVVTTIPTIGFCVETVKRSGVEIQTWDVGGRGKIRPLWRHYFAQADGLIFMVDSGDSERILEAQRELESSLSEVELEGVPVLILANKKDLPNHLTLHEITDSLQLSSYRDRPWYIAETNALTGDGLYDGLEWITAAISRRKAGDDITEVIKSGKDAIRSNYGTAIMEKIKKLWVPSSNKAAIPG